MCGIINWKKTRAELSVRMVLVNAHGQCTSFLLLLMPLVPYLLHGSPTPSHCIALQDVRLGNQPDLLLEGEDRKGRMKVTVAVSCLYPTLVL